MKQKKIAVIGGGASGMMAAITASKQGAKVTVFEGNDRVGKKILATGNGKCNFSNENMIENCFYASDASFVERALQTFGVKQSRDFFESMGMLIRDREGYLYPASEQASTVLDLLRTEMEKAGVRLVTEAKIKTVSVLDAHKFVLRINEKEEVFDSLIVACGSQAAPKTGSDGSGYKLAKNLGHHIVPVVPALVQLRTKENLKAVSGVRAQAELSLKIDGKEAAREKGELQLTDYGVSGIVVFQMSRTAAYALKENKKVTVSVDFLRDFSKAEYEEFIAGRLECLKDRSVEQFFTGMLNKKLMIYFAKQAGLSLEMPVKNADKEKLLNVFGLCKNWTLHINATNSFENAQVCAGGVALSEVTDKMESKIHPGLFFAGEILDVDGKCGGYNLQWAWTSGYIAGLHAAK